jgi:hypothetical protein
VREDITICTKPGRNLTRLDQLFRDGRDKVWVPDKAKNELNCSFSIAAYPSDALFHVQVSDETLQESDPICFKNGSIDEQVVSQYDCKVQVIFVLKLH